MLAIVRPTFLVCNGKHTPAPILSLSLPAAEFQGKGYMVIYDGKLKVFLKEAGEDLS